MKLNSTVLRNVVWPLIISLTFLAASSSASVFKIITSYRFNSINNGGDAGNRNPRSPSLMPYTASRDASTSRFAAASSFVPFCWQSMPISVRSRSRKASRKSASESISPRASCACDINQIQHAHILAPVGAVHRPCGRVAKWQARWLQVPVFARTWGFKSPLAHHLVERCHSIGVR